jgi:hypothetical protein
MVAHAVKKCSCISMVVYVAQNTKGTTHLEVF